ncbi:MAG: dihydrofolate reductase family protein [Candidatus Dormiibacterota bacterium]
MPRSGSESAATLDPLELLVQAPGQPSYPLPPVLGRLYGGSFGLPAGLLYSNFVTSLDGVAVVGPSSGSTLSGKSQADRFVMGLLRSTADAILIGSGTLDASPGHVWTAEHVFAPEAIAFAELRQALHLAKWPTLVVVSGSGDIDLNHPGLLHQPCLLITSDEGQRRLGGASGHQVVSLGPGPDLDPVQIIAAVREAGHSMVLTEGGPRLLAQLVGAEQLDQLFLTISPLLAGAAKEGPRRGFIDGVDLLARDQPPWLTLLSARRHGSHLFLRYQLETAVAKAT